MSKTEMHYKADDGQNRVASCSTPGCVTSIAILLVLWALIFGITYDGKHYGLNCSCSKGVVIESP